MVAFASWDIEQYVYCNCLLTRLWRHKTSIQRRLSNQAFFSTWPISQDKSWNILKRKKAFFIIFKGFLLKQIKQFFRRWEPDFKDFFSKCGQIRRKLQIWSHLQKKSLMQTSFSMQWKHLRSATSRLFEALFSPSPTPTKFPRYINVNKFYLNLISIYRHHLLEFHNRTKRTCQNTINKIRHFFRFILTGVTIGHSLVK